jgi:sarcosine oxidase delta subunit
MFRETCSGLIRDRRFKKHVRTTCVYLIKYLKKAIQSNPKTNKERNAWYKFYVEIYVEIAMIKQEAQKHHATQRKFLVVTRAGASWRIKKKTQLKVSSPKYLSR